MTKTESAEKGIKIVSEAIGKAIAIGGVLRQGAAGIEENPACGTTACFGGWLANHLKTHVYEAGSRSFTDGKVAFVEELGFYSFREMRQELNCSLWHNSFMWDAFGGSDIAYNGGGTTTLQDVAELWIDFFCRVIVEEMSDEQINELCEEV